MLEGVPRQFKCALGGFKDLSPSRMHDDPIEVIQRETLPSKERIQRWAKILSRTSWDVWAQHDTEAVVLNGPAHHILGVRPHMLTRCDDARQGLRYVGPRLAPQQQAGGTVTEQCR